MRPDTPVSRRRLLKGACAALALARLEAMPDARVFGLDALLDGSGLVRIPAGEFVMGSDAGNRDEMPSHRVHITRAFEIGKYEVSQSQWKTVMTNPHAKPGEGHPTPDGGTVGNDPSHFKGDSLPIESVSWDDIQVFLQRLNARDDQHGYRLPTEAEWEYAAKGGKRAADPKTLLSSAWYKPNSGQTTHAIGEKSPNAWGLQDTRGNVSEWVHDWYGPNYYSGGPATDPQGPGESSYRVYRGGCWFDPEPDCRLTLRRFDFPVSRFYNVGFRVIRTAK